MDITVTIAAGAPEHKNLAGAFRKVLAKPRAVKRPITRTAKIVDEKLQQLVDEQFQKLSDPS